MLDDEWLAALLAGNSMVAPFDERAALATAAAHGLGLATRNLAGCGGRGAPLYDPVQDVHVAG